jgi:hypothetical protein
MAWKLIGKGSQYAWGYLDAKGNYLDGSKTYKLNLPKNPPANKFISIVAYDPQTRSELQTGQPFPSYNNVRDQDKVIVNDDGSVDLYFGPEAPALANVRHPFQAPTLSHGHPPVLRKRLPQWAVEVPDPASKEHPRSRGGTPKVGRRSNVRFLNTQHT